MKFVQTYTLIGNDRRGYGVVVQTVNDGGSWQPDACSDDSEWTSGAIRDSVPVLAVHRSARNIPPFSHSSGLWLRCGWFRDQTTWIGGLSIIRCSAGWGDRYGRGREAHMLGSGCWELRPGNRVFSHVFWLVNCTCMARDRLDQNGWNRAAPFLILGAGRLLPRPSKCTTPPAQRVHSVRGVRNSDTSSLGLVPQLTAMVGFWATLSLNNIGLHARRDQEAPSVGQGFGLPTTMALFCFIGIAVTSATPIIFGRTIWDPTEVIARIGSGPVIIISLIMRFPLPTLTTNIAANVSARERHDTLLNPRRISFRMGGMITAGALYSDDAVVPLHSNLPPLHLDRLSVRRPDCWNHALRLLLHSADA